MRQTGFELARLARETVAPEWITAAHRDLEEKFALAKAEIADAANSQGSSTSPDTGDTGP